MVLELPIDHFRLLGVSPSVEADGILRALQLRLDKSPQDGFTQEALIHRAELLRLSADLLTNQKLREEYESALLSGAVGLELSSKREVAGLLLLLEADSPFEAFKLSCKALKPPQTPALGSGREADLTLVAALSCRAAAIHEQNDRHFETAAQLLGEGLQLLQRMGKLPEYREILEKDLKTLMPYRILDLVSRDIGDQLSHQEGLRLFDDLVVKRGGLEGGKDSNNIGELNQNDFEIFFQQIRKFLTVQEQSDLYLRWQKVGSLDASFLRVLSLVADGFSRRKPERINEAKRSLKKIKMIGLDPMPLLGCMDLLLGDVSRAEESFNNSEDEELQFWLNDYPGDSLASLCEYCINWLKKDVLPGFRDVDAIAPVDLEAWFADRDVQSYIENLDKKGSGVFSKAGFNFLSSDRSESPKSKSDKYMSELNEIDSESFSEINPIVPEQNQKTYSDLENDQQSNGDLFVVSAYTRFIIDSIISFSEKFSGFFSRVRYRPYILALFIALGSFFAVSSYRNRPSIDNAIDNELIQSSDTKIESDKEIDVSINEAAVSSVEEEPFKPLVLESPTQEQIKFLLDAWLYNKSLILSGQNSFSLELIARKQLIDKLLDQREKDDSLNRFQETEAVIKSIDLVSQTNKRIQVKAIISYKDKLLNESGDLISETSIPVLNVTYILGREKEQWQLVDYISGV